MHILHIIIGLEIGGAELVLKRLIESHMGSRKYCHTVISLRDIGAIGLQLQSLGVKVHALGAHSILDIPRVMWRLVRLIRTYHPDIVQTWMYHANLLGGVAARIAGNRNVIWGIRTTHLVGSCFSMTSIIRSLCAGLSWLVPHTVVCAANASRQAHIAIGYCAARMVVVPNGFDLSCLVATIDQRDELRTYCGFSAEVVVIGYLGRFHEDKDPANFVRAAGLVAKQYKDAFFLMIGHGQDYKNNQLVEWISTTGFADRFVLLGERADVPACLASMDIFCLSSRNEGFPNVAGEAMAMGLPCVVTDVGDAAMLVSDTGVIVPKEDSAALARGVASLLTMKPHARNKLGQKARMRIQSEFNMEGTRERFESIYQSMENKGDQVNC